MTVYIDLVCIINFIYDFLILLTVSFTLKRNRKIYNYILSSLIGVLSIFLLFLKINNIVLFLLKILISVIMIIVAFGYKSIKYTISNIIYFYMTSIVLAGFLYLIKGNSSNFNLNYIVLLIIGPIILFIYYKSNKKLKNTISIKRGFIPAMNFAFCPKSIAIGCDKCKEKNIIDSKNNVVIFDCVRMHNKISFILENINNKNGEIDIFI